MFLGIATAIVVISSLVMFSGHDNFLSKTDTEILLDTPISAFAEGEAIVEEAEKEILEIEEDIILPTDGLSYTFKIIGEGFREFFTFDGAEKEKLNEELIEEREREIAILTLQGEQIPDTVVKDYKKRIDALKATEINNKPSKQINPSSIDPRMTSLSYYYDSNVSGPMSEEDLIVNQIGSKIGSNILQECGRDHMCAYRAIEDLSKYESQDVVMFVVNYVPKQWEKETQTCHDIAHHLGYFILGYFNGDLNEAISHVDSVCGNALYHGVVENIFPVQVQVKGIELEDLDITSPCMNIGSSIDSNRHQQCVHGLGHSLANVYDYDVFKAVKRCEEFERKIDRYRCGDGLFMDHQNHFRKTGEGSFDENDIFYPCNKIDGDEFKRSCYFYQGYHILRINDTLYKPSFEQCKEAPDENFIGSCISAVAQEMTYHHYYTDVEKNNKMCNELVDPQYQKECILASLNAITLYLDSDMGDDYCNSFNEEQTEYCLRHWEFVKEFNT